MFKVKEDSTKDPLYKRAERLYYKTKSKDEEAYFASEATTAAPKRPTPSRVKTGKRTVAQTRETAPVGGPSVRLRSVKKPAVKGKKTPARKKPSGKDKKPSGKDKKPTKKK